MSYDIALIGSRVNTDVALETAKRLITVLLHPSNSQGGVIRLIHTKNPFEIEIVRYCTRELSSGFRSIQLSYDRRAAQKYQSWVRMAHPAPKKLSGKAWKDLLTVARVIDNSHVVIAAPYRQGRGRATVALKIAAYNFAQTFDLSSPICAKLLEKEEQRISKAEEHVHALEAHKACIAEARRKLKIQKSKEFMEGVMAEIERHGIDVPHIIEYVVTRAQDLYDGGYVRSPSIQTLRVERLGGATVLQELLFTDEYNGINIPGRVRRIRRKRRLPRRRTEPRANARNTPAGRHMVDALRETLERIQADDLERAVINEMLERRR